MSNDATTLRERLQDGWGPTAREEYQRAREATMRFGDRAMRVGDRAWKEAKRAGVRAQKEAAGAGKRLSMAMPRQRARRERRRRVALFAGGTALGVAVAYLFDPVQGKGRRTRLVDQATALFRQMSRRAERMGRRVASDGEGLSDRMRHATRDYTPPNDVTLARKVESEVLGRPDIPAGSVLVNVEHGVVVLRGQVDRPELIPELDGAVRRVDGVQGVENLLHAPGEAAPNKAEAHGAGW